MPVDRFCCCDGALAGARSLDARDEALVLASVARGVGRASRAEYFNGQRLAESAEGEARACESYVFQAGLCEEFEEIK